MAYSNFTLRKVKQEFGLTIEEQGSFLPEIVPIVPIDYLTETLRRNLALAIAVDTEKARSELLISPLLVELRTYALTKESKAGSNPGNFR